MGKIARAFVCGWPVEHSRSPIIHKYWLNQAGLDGAYIKQAVSPDHFAAFLSKLEASGFVGGNITIPHKERAFQLVDHADTVAASLQAVNTVWLKNGQLHGANTDAYGFLANLDQRAPGWDSGANKTAIVLGAGGAARAIVYGLRLRKFTSIELVNRTLERAQEIAGAFRSGVIARKWQELPDLLGGASLLVNTTSLGMQAKPPLEIDLSPLQPDCLVTDIVYVPLQTGLLQQANRLGLKTVDGLGMLLHQAVPAFEKWFGVKPSVTGELRQLLVEDIER